MRPVRPIQSVCLLSLCALKYDHSFSSLAPWVSATCLVLKAIHPLRVSEVLIRWRCRSRWRRACVTWHLVGPAPACHWAPMDLIPRLREQTGRGRQVSLLSLWKCLRDGTAAAAAEPRGPNGDGEPLTAAGAHKSGGGRGAMQETLALATGALPLHLSKISPVGSTQVPVICSTWGSRISGGLWLPTGFFKGPRHCCALESQGLGAVANLVRRMDCWDFKTTQRSLRRKRRELGPGFSCDTNRKLALVWSHQRWGCTLSYLQEVCDCWQPAGLNIT